ncbi:hypothetical protein [Paenibacillus sp. FSL L8-0709]|uniref:hypothetical protein n=1 Tax=Paenibacillus sp. FSL L8-0709 TaxID=2975312 RepID=UPI0030F6DDB7
MSLTRDQILGILLDNLKEGIWILAILHKEEAPLAKEKLKIKVNEHYRSQHDGVELITSRHILDVLCAKLEGAALVDVDTSRDRATKYSISELGKLIIEEYGKRQRR